MNCGCKINLTPIELLYANTYIPKQTHCLFSLSATMHGNHSEVKTTNLFLQWHACMRVGMCSKFGSKQTFSVFDDLFLFHSSVTSMIRVKEVMLCGGHNDVVIHLVFKPSNS